MDAASAARGCLPGVAKAERSEPLARASALRHDRRALKVADEVRILADAEDREAVEQIPRQRLVDEQAGLPVLEASTRVERGQDAARGERVRRADAEVIIRELVAHEFQADVRADVGRVRDGGGKFDV